MVTVFLVRGQQRVVEGVLRAGRRAAGRRPPHLAGGAVAQYWYRAEPNVGDALSPVFVCASLGQRSQWVSSGFKGKVLGLGSIIHRIQAGDVVAGSGAIRPDHVELPKGAAVAWVRGPLTRRCLGPRNVPELYGDPGLLLRDVICCIDPGLEAKVPGSNRIGVVAHYVDQGLVSAAAAHEDVVLLDVRAAPAEFLDALRRCRAVLSSSLHGIIFAEALGIPALWLIPHADMSGGRFKFDDYYLGTNREGVHPLTLHEGLERARAGLSHALLDLSGPRLAQERLREELVGRMSGPRRKR